MWCRCGQRRPHSWCSPCTSQRKSCDPPAGVFTSASQRRWGKRAAALGGPASRAPGQASRMAAPHRQCAALGANTNRTCGGWQQCCLAVRRPKQQARACQRLGRPTGLGARPGLCHRELGCQGGQLRCACRPTRPSGRSSSSTRESGGKEEMSSSGLSPLALTLRTMVILICWQGEGAVWAVLERWERGRGGRSSSLPVITRASPSGCKQAVAPLWHAGARAGIHTLCNQCVSRCHAAGRRTGKDEMPQGPSSLPSRVQMSGPRGTGAALVSLKPAAGAAGGCGWPSLGDPGDNGGRCGELGGDGGPTPLGDVGEAMESVSTTRAPARDSCDTWGHGRWQVVGYA